MLDNFSLLSGGVDTNIDIYFWENIVVLVAGAICLKMICGELIDNLEVTLQV